MRSRQAVAVICALAALVGVASVDPKSRKLFVFEPMILPGN